MPTNKQLEVQVNQLADKVDRVIESAPVEPPSRIARWVHHNPWILSIVIVLLVAVPGYIRMQQIADQNSKAVDNTQQVVDGNAHLMDCLQRWGDGMTARNVAQDKVISKRLDHITKALGYAVKRNQRGVTRETTAMRAEYQHRQDKAPTPKLRC